MPRQLRPPTSYEARPDRQVMTGNSGLAIASLVLGIVAFFTGMIPVWGLVVGGTAVALGVAARRNRQGRGLETYGIATGVIGAIASTATLVLLLTTGGDGEGSSIHIGMAPDQTTYGPAPSEDEYAVAEQAFGPSSSDPSATWFVVILHNPSDQSFALNNVLVTALDATGMELDSELELPDIPPGDFAVIGTFEGLSSDKISSLRVKGDILADSRGSVAPSATLSNVSSHVDDGTVVTGTVTFGNPRPTFGAGVTVVVRDPDGKIAGATHTNTQTNLDSQSENFRATFDKIWPDGTTYEVYVAPQ